MVFDVSVPFDCEAEFVAQGGGSWKLDGSDARVEGGVIVLRPGKHRHRPRVTERRPGPAAGAAGNRRIARERAGRRFSQKWLTFSPEGCIIHAPFRRLAEEGGGRGPRRMKR